ncbi:MAG: ATP-binding protein, partial [Candidatus Riflebacteria bacterium]|nr:ATP-binding protein [Candidatus Riflebacteria bacterium]
KQQFKLYYYTKENSTLEEDFFIRTADKLIPLEVKSNTHSSKSLSTLIKSASYPDIKCGIKLFAGNIGYSDKIYSFPYFCAFLLKRALGDLS